MKNEGYTDFQKSVIGKSKSEWEAVLTTEKQLSVRLTERTAIGQNTVLYLAVRSRDPALVKALVACCKEHSVSLDSTNSGGETALHLALRLAVINNEIIKCLVRAGAATDIEDNQGQTAKALAEHRGINLNFDTAKPKPQDSIKNNIGSTLMSPPSTTPAPPSPPTTSGNVAVQPRQQVVTCH